MLLFQVATNLGRLFLGPFSIIHHKTQTRQLNQISYGRQGACAVHSLRHPKGNEIGVAYLSVHKKTSDNSIKVLKKVVETSSKQHQCLQSQSRYQGAFNPQES